MLDICNRILPNNRRVEYNCSDFLNLIILAHIRTLTILNLFRVGRFSTISGTIFFCGANSLEFLVDKAFLTLFKKYLRKIMKTYTCMNFIRGMYRNYKVIIMLVSNGLAVRLATVCDYMMTSVYYIMFSLYILDVFSLLFV